jgi:signal transduction histidine kinase
MRSGQKSARKRPVRLKIFLLLVAPLISVIGLWVFAASLTVGDARKQLHTDTVAQKLAIPLGTLQGMLTPESLLSVVAMGTHSPADQKALAAQRARTDGALAVVRDAIGTSKVRGATSPALRGELEGMIGQLGRLADIRATVDAGNESRLAVIGAYGDLYGIATKVQEDVGVASLVDPEIYHQAIPLYAVGQGDDLITREEAVVLGALASGARSLNAAESMAFGQFVANRRLMFEGVAANPDPALGTALRDVLGTEPYAGLTAIENRILAIRPTAPLPADAQQLGAAGEAVKASYQKISQPLSTALIDRAQRAGRPVLIRLALAGGIGLLAVGLSLLLSIRLGRGLNRELTGLQGAARDLADERLPRIMQRLRDDEPVNIDAEAPPLNIGETSEVAKVGEAFTTVQRTAIEAAVGQANLRRGVRQVFLNLARRSQSLLHRQLSMLDAMERKTTDPDALDELFRLDHLTTRMRRHAEGLIILSGALPARAWSTPVRAVDVVRGAIAEVESYTRVRLYVLTEASLVGAAVADVTHLVAELVENAATFSPPHTQVQVRAESVSNGFVIEIEDAGLGMSPEQLADVNEQLAKPPDFDLADTDRLGLFVVAQLAARHGIKVTLRQSPYGGTTAIILLPSVLVAPQGAIEAGDATHGRGGAQAIPPGAPVPAGPPVRTRDQGRDWQVPSAVMEAESAVGNVGNGPAVGNGSIVGNGPIVRNGPVVDAGPLLEVGPQTPALTGRHRRIAGFLQRTRELQANEPLPRASAEWIKDGTDPDWPGATFDLWAPPESRPASAGTHAGLPRRVRKASLAPQLRDEPPPGPGEAEPDADGARSPEQARAVMSSLQSGWERGRADAGSASGPHGDERG